MTVIAWDGKTLAADRQGTSAGVTCSIIKLYPLKSGEVMAFTGSPSWVPGLIDWYTSGATPPTYPLISENDRTTLVLASPDGKVVVYDGTPYPIPLLERAGAWGNGREFAIGAMAAGASAIRAVEVACKHSAYCGHGIDAHVVVK